MSEANSIPTFRTERLVFRGHTIDDLDDCAAMWADPGVTRHIGGKAFSRQDVWSKLLRYVGHWSLLGFGYWVIEDRATGAFVGEVGFADFKRDMEPSFGDTPEIGWALASWAHGRGFATEAVRAAVAWGTEHLASKRTACMINPENLQSIRVAEKCGYAEYLRATYMDKPIILFHR